MGNCVCCLRCFQEVQAEYEAIHDADTRLQWYLDMNNKLHSLKDKARMVGQVATTVGMTVGGVTAAVAGAAVSATAGFVQGETAALTATPAVTDVPAPPDPHPDARPLRRTNSDGNLIVRDGKATSEYPECALCLKTSKSKGHTFLPNCGGLPREVWFRPAGTRGRATPSLPSPRSLGLGDSGGPASSLSG